MTKTNIRSAKTNTIGAPQGAGQPEGVSGQRSSQEGPGAPGDAEALSTGARGDAGRRQRGQGKRERERERPSERSAPLSSSLGNAPLHEKCKAKS